MESSLEQTWAIQVRSYMCTYRHVHARFIRSHDVLPSDTLCASPCLFLPVPPPRHPRPRAGCTHIRRCFWSHVRRGLRRRATGVIRVGLVFRARATSDRRNAYISAARRCVAWCCTTLQGVARYTVHGTWYMAHIAMLRMTLPPIADSKDPSPCSLHVPHQTPRQTPDHAALIMPLFPLCLY